MKNLQSIDESVGDSYQVSVNGKIYSVVFNSRKNLAVVDGENVEMNVHFEREPDLYSFLIDGRSSLLAIEQNGEVGSFRVHTRGFDYETEVMTSREAKMREFIRGAAGGKKETKIKAPMPGLIVKRMVEEGAAVRRGQGILIMEAMKMENEIKATTDGTLTKFLVNNGNAVEKGQVLCELE